jgi:hypothetical protein
MPFLKHGKYGNSGDKITLLQNFKGCNQFETTLTARGSGLGLCLEVTGDFMGHGRDL